MRSGYRFLALPLAIVAATGQGTASNAAVAAQCEIRTADTSGGLHLQALALAGAHEAGEYELEVKKSGGGGTSSTSQSGDFTLWGKSEVVLSEVTIGGGGSLAAKLTLWSTAGDIICTTSYPDKA